MVKLTLAFLVLVLGIVMLVYVVNPYQLYKESSFKSFYGNLERSIEKLDCSAIYNYKSDQYKNRVRFNYYVVNCDGNKKSLTEHIEVHNLWVIGDTGYADRTRKSCLTGICTGDGMIEKREVKRYFFIEGNWTIPDDDQPLEISK